jgi:Spy/CpxP family protein refolding chaperone
MKIMKTKNTILAAVLALGVSAFAAGAQDNTPPAGGPPGGNSQQSGMREGGPRGPRGFHLLPPRAAERLSLTDEQQNQIAALEAETKAKLEKILTPDQLEQLKNMRPPMRQGGPGMHRGPGGPGGDNMPPNGPPPGGDNGNNPPPGGPPSDQ